MDVASAIVKILVAEGVRLAAGITGQSIGALADALSSSKEIELLYTRQERVAVDICDGYARVTGVPGVAFTDNGVAAANAMGGLVNSWGDSTPLLMFAGHNGRLDAAGRQVKEIPFEQTFAPFSKWVTVLRDPSQVVSTMRRAFVQLRTGRSGPVVIGLPVDLGAMEFGEFDYEPLPAASMRSGADPQAVVEAVRMLASASRPYVYVGAGVLASGASEELLELAELLSLPVATTLNGKSAFPETHGLSLGIGGFARATYSSLPATILGQSADVVLTIGCGFKRFATTAKPAAGARHIQVDIDGSELHKDHRADLALLGDAKVVLRQFIDAAKAHVSQARLRPDADRRSNVLALRERWTAVSRPLLESQQMPINPFRVTATLAACVDPDETIVLHDAGSVRGTTCQHYVATRPHSFIGFGVQSAMGWSIGAAMGAKKAEPGKLVVAVMGDEAFGETALDLETSVRTQVPVLIVVKNNRAEPATDAGHSKQLASTRFAGAGIDPCAIAVAVGAKAIRVERHEELQSAMKDAVAQVRAGSTVVLEVLTKRVKGSLHSLWEDAAQVSAKV